MFVYFLENVATHQIGLWLSEFIREERTFPFPTPSPTQTALTQYKLSPIVAKGPKWKKGVGWGVMIGMLKGLKLAQEMWLTLSVLKSGVEPLRETKVGGDWKGSLSVGWSVGQFWTLAGLTVSRAFQQLQRREREWERLRRYFPIKYLFSWSLILNFGFKGLYKSLNQDYKVWSAFKITEIWVFDMMYLCDRMVLDITFHVSCYYINPAASSYFSSTLSFLSGSFASM